MAIPAEFAAIAEHRAPGMRFPAHEQAGTAEQVIAAPHQFGLPASPNDLDRLREWTAPCPSAQAELLEFYSRWDGAALCCSPDPFNPGLAPALQILPIAEWEAYTSELIEGPLAFLLEDLADLYVPGHFVVIAANDSESTRLVLMLKGQYEGNRLDGNILYLALDPVLSDVEPVATSFFNLLSAFGSDPVSFLIRIGWCYALESDGKLYGAIPDAYLPSIDQFS